MPATSFICSHYSGYATSRGNLAYTTIWTDAFKTSGEIMFYGTIGQPRSMKDVVDIEINRGDTIAIGTYPHNQRDIFTEILKPENRGNVELLVANLRHKYPGKAMVTVDLDTMEEVTPESFSHFNPGCLTKEMGYAGFIFANCIAPEKAFPTIYVMEYRDNEDQIRSFPIQTWCSRWIHRPAGEITSLGRQITYMLINSNFKGEFKGVTPSIKTMNFPSMPVDRVPPQHTDALEAFIEISGVKNLKRVGDKVIDTSPVESAEDITHKGNEIYGLEDNNTLSEVIAEEVVHKNSITFSNLIAYGIYETIKLIGTTEKPVEINMDLPGYASRMCLHEGYIYAVPYNTTESAVGLEENLGEYLVLCTAETMPLVLYKSNLLN